MSSSHEAVEQAISFLTTPLSKTTVSSHAISVLRSHLTASLLTLSARSGPVGVSLRLAAAAPPPECIGRACDVSGVNWSEWLFLIGGGMGLDLDVNVTPTAVTASFCRAGTPSLGLVTVWQKEEPTRHLSTRELLYADDDAEELFNEINRSQHSPSWLSSWGLNGNAASYVRQPSALSSPMPVPKMHAVPPTARSSHSRSSSYASSNAGHSPNAHYAQHGQHQGQGQAYYGGERAPSACSNHSASSNHSGRSSEDGSTGSSGALSWTRRGTVVPGPQQSAILAARNAHALQQQQQQQAQQQQLAYQQLAPMSHHPGHSPSPSITSLASVSSTGSGGSGGKQHRRQRSTSGNGTTAAVVDPSKASVTAYDGGKTKVMTGGVMLGAVTSGNKKKRAY